MAEDPMAWWEKREYTSLKYWHGDSLTPEEKRKRLKLIVLVLSVEGAIGFLLYKAFMYLMHHN